MVDKERQAPSQASIEGYLKVTGVKQGSIKSIIVESNQRREEREGRGKRGFVTFQYPAQLGTVRR